MRCGSIRWIFAAAVMTAAFTAPVAAQTQAASGESGFPMGFGVGLGEVDEATREKRNEIERAYKNATQKIPTQAAANDPWAGMRGAEEAKPAAKPAARTAKKPAR